MSTLTKKLDQGGRQKQLADATEGPWMKWNVKQRHLRAIKFIETYCIVPKGYGVGQPIKLATFQKEWLEEVIRPGIIHAAVESIPRGNGKSTFKAALGLWGVFDPPESGDPQIPIVASTVKQACKTIFNPAVRMVNMHDDLSNRCKVYTAITDTKIQVPFTNGEMFPISDDPDGLQGLDPSLGLVDEIGFLKIDSWASLLLATGKRSDSLILAIGTPGFTKENSALWHIRNNHFHDTSLHYTEYAADEGCDIENKEQWRKSNPAYVAGFKGEHAFSVALDLPESLFRIFQLGQWVDGVEGWLGPTGSRLWNGLIRPQKLAVGAPTWVGLDVGVKRDSTALVAIQRRMETNDQVNEPTYHASCTIWMPAKGKPVDISEIMQHIRLMDQTYDLQEVAYDPRFFEVPAQMLSAEGISMTEFPQSLERMSPAFGLLLQAIKQSRLTHDGDETFTMQVVNAVARYNDRGFTLQKNKDNVKIDAAYALAMAFARAHVEKKKKPKLVAL